MREIKFNDKILQVESLRVVIQPLSNINDSSVSLYTNNYQKLKNFIREPKKITLSFPFQNVSEKVIIEKVSTFFFSDKEKVLINPKDETKYFLVKIQGEIDVVTEGNYSIVTVNLYSYDGYMYSIDENIFSKNASTSTITVNNEGTYDANAVFEIDFTEDTDYVALITDKDIIQLGTVDDSDIDKPKLTKTIFIDEMGSASNGKWSEGVARIRHTPDNANLSGRVQWRSDDVMMSNYGSGEGYHGSSLTRYLADDDVENWEFTFRVGFITSTATKRSSQVGIAEGNILDADNNFIAGYNLKKPNTANENVEYAWYIGDTRVFLGVVPYKYRNFFGNITIKKVGNKITFSIGGFDENWKFNWQYSRSFTNDDVANLRFKSASVYMAGYGDKPTMYQRVSYTKCVKIGTSEISEVPLTFSAGDHLEITENLKVFLNGTPADDYLANGSEKMSLARGETQIVVASDKSPNVIAKVRPKYL